MPGFHRMRAALGTFAIFAVLAVVACATGCTSSASAAKPSQAPSSAASRAGAVGASGGAGGASAPAGPAPTTLAQYYAQRLDWRPCRGSFECARLLVPFDYARPDWRRFSLPVIKLVAAEPEGRIGALVINPGGPGGSGVQYALGARNGEFTSGILGRFDIVGFDPRGVGGSQPAVRCMSGPQLDKYFATDDAPGTSAQLAAVVSESKLYASQCASKDAELLPYVGTVNAAKDMDVLRAALGEPTLTYLGKSYGTVLGASYAQQFPSRVRALVLDGAVNPALSGVQLDIAQAQGFESSFGQFAAWCATQSGCPFGSGAAQSAAVVSGAVAKVAGLLAQANKHPLTNMLSNGQPANGAMLLNGIASALYLRQEWPILKNALSGAFDGDGTVLIELANVLMERNPNGTYSNLSDAELSVDCVDRPWPRSLAAWSAAAAAASKSAPLFGAPIVWGSLPCAYWTVKPSAVLTARAAGAPPILVVGDLHDPATPYQWAVGLAHDLTSGVLLGWNGEGHTSYMEGSTCVDNTVDAYLISRHTPRSGTVCP